MIELFRKEIKNDPAFTMLLQVIVNNHKIPKYTEETLIKNKDVKDFCECSRHYITMSGENPLYIHYDVYSWYKHPNGASVRVQSIGLYDDFMEYEAARLKGLHGSERADIPNIN